MKIEKENIMNVAMMLIGLVTASANDLILSKAQHYFADNEGVKIHYVVVGDGPLVVMIHGFPDFWYSWRNQMAGLSDKFRVVAVDLRGYNLSGKPQGVENYTMSRLVSDILTVIQHLGEERAIVVGHDWGGAIAWAIAMTQPDIVEKLIICNLPHLKGLQRELTRNPEQQKNSQYARDFQQPNAHLKLTAEILAEWVTNPDTKKLYIEAFEKSDLEAMLNYYKANYPKPPYVENDSPVVKVKCPVLMFHGLEDSALLPGALNDTWKWIDNELTLMTIPDAGHFVQHDASERVTQVIRRWLLE